MPKAARTPESAAREAAQRPAGPFKKQRFTVFLVTGDDSLWPLIGADLSGDLILKQLDSIDELLATVPAGQAGIVLWDAREHADAAATLSALALHSNRFALLVLDSASNAGVWTLPLHHRQIVANVGLPLSSVVLGKALESAREEVNARMALLGRSSGGPDAGGPPEAANKTRWLPAAIAAAILAAAAAAFVLTRQGGASHSAGYGARDIAPAAPAMAEPPPASAGGAPATDDKVDGLIADAQRAMLDRHYIDPAAGSALELYRVVLLIDPSNGEARQGLERLAEILIARVESALDERKFDVALQSLETARSIDANDHRLSALDERIAGLRAELGPAQITAALNAQNFDRANQLLDDAARARSLPPAKLAQLRDDVRRRREEFDSERLLKLAETRLQGKPLEPRNLNVPEAAVPAKPEQPQDLDLAQSRLAQGKPLEPGNDKARTALDAGDAAAADSKAEAGAAPVVAERTLTRLNTLDIAYPYRAQAANVEGWVEIGFTVNADGSVGNVAVLNASPPRTFEQAGVKAVSKLRYAPVVQDGKAVAVTSQIRVVFRLPK